MNNELYEKLTKLQWLLHRQQIQGYRQGENLADATRGQGRILAVLKLRDGISTKDLAYLLGVRVSSLNELLSKLEKSGHVTREPSEHDKRVMLVMLTEKGKSQQAQTDNPTNASDIFDCLTEDEQAAFGAYLDKVIDALGAKLGFDDDEFEWLKSAQDERSRLFAEMSEHGRGFHDFRGGLRGMGGFGRRGFERGGFGRPNQKKGTGSEGGE
ncbi:MAG: MarR family transcriptional regulator [Eggerthellaceae bacterium]|jgi:DNA-binding MarR family transcriptional regulator|nr:MarR family transcriptional regulator [Eggerthellaceae bacterium]MDR2715451.1 MarR family transcriptional regulator [Coriobacteriaceae bacterium]